MEGLATFGGLVIGILLRFGIPIGLTLALGWLLRKLDARWRGEAEQIRAEAVLRAEQDIYFTIWSRNPCWEKNDCPPERRAKCNAYLQSDEPCWEVFRTNGTYNKACLDCDYRKEAMLKIETFN